jgi:plastocyanin
MRKVAIVAAALALLGVGCSSKTPAAKKAAAQTFVIQVDHKSDVVNTAFFHFFPSEITVHAGDSLRFGFPKDNGEPHTATFGTLVQAALDAVDKAGGPSIGFAAASQLPEMQKVPDILPAGPGDANQSAAQPCFLATGTPPGAAACPTVPQPDFTGTEADFNSGLLQEGKPFSMRLASSIAPGTYRFMCAVHREAMQGKVTVVPGSQSVPSPDDVAKKREEEITKAVASMKAANDAATAQAKPGAVNAGVFAQDVQFGLASTFAPKEISIAVGGTVTWLIQGPHSIAFNAPDSLVGILTIAPDGSVHLRPESLAPTGGPGEPPGTFPAAKPTTVTIDAKSWNGQGLHTSGLLLGFPPLTEFYKLRFTAAGTYKYLCTVHPDMEGTVKVG